MYDTFISQVRKGRSLGPSDGDAGLTPVKGECEGSGSKSVRLQLSAEKVPPRRMGIPQPALLIRGSLQGAGTPARFSH